MCGQPFPSAIAPTAPWYLLKVVMSPAVVFLEIVTVRVLRAVRDSAVKTKR